MDTIEAIEKYMWQEWEGEINILPMIQIRILIQIAYQLQGLTAAIKNMRDV